ncbi:MAG: heme-binding protein [Alphaproteobacteria bacterium]|nr:MAG: heme-binding protein [Alphaproteobacteria bacterium]
MALTVTTRHVTTDAARRATEAALEHARTLGISISVAVVDRGGAVLSLVRDNDAPFHTASIAEDKAATAASFGAPTAAFGEALHNMGPVVFHGILQRSRMAAFGGGLPIMHDDERVGGIGVSGGKAEQDEACARAGLDALKA